MENLTGDEIYDAAKRAVELAKERGEIQDYELCQFQLIQVQEDDGVWSHRMSARQLLESAFFISKETVEDALN